MDATAGYVYVLINASLNGIVKIGKTQNSPDERAKELSSATGVPSPFLVAYSSYFKDCNAAEIFVHTRLENNRLAENKEFFRVSVQQAIEAIREAESTLGVIPEPAKNIDIQPKGTSTKPLAPWKVIFNSANAHKYGLGETIQDQSEALELYIKATKLGSTSAYWIIGNMYLRGQGCNKDNLKAKTAFLEGTKAGNDLCWTGLAELYFLEPHVENWNKCWKRYFDSPLFNKRIQFDEYVQEEALMSSGAYQMCVYIYQTIGKNWNMSHQQLILESRAEILGFALTYSVNTKDTKFAKQIGDSISNLLKKAGGEVPQKIVGGTSSEHYANYYNKSMNVVHQALEQSKSSFLPPLTESELKHKKPLEIFQLANRFYYYDTSENHEKKALYLYEKAALTGFKLGYWKLGRIYSGSYNVVADKDKAIKFLNKGVDLGVDLCWTELASIFAERKDFDRWNNCWKRYYQSKTFSNNIVFNELIEFDKLKSCREYQMFFYIQQMSGHQWKTPYMSIVTKNRQKIMELILRDPNSICVGEIPVNEIIELIKITEPKNAKGAKDYCLEILAKIPVA